MCVLNHHTARVRPEFWRSDVKLRRGIRAGAGDDVEDSELGDDRAGPSRHGTPTTADAAPTTQGASRTIAVIMIVMTVIIMNCPPFRALAPG